MAERAEQKAKAPGRGVWFYPGDRVREIGLVIAAVGDPRRQNRQYLLVQWDSTYTETQAGILVNDPTLNQSNITRPWTIPLGILKSLLPDAQNMA